MSETGLVLVDTLDPRLRPPQGGLTVRQESAEGVVVRGVGRASEAPQRRKTRPTDRPQPVTADEGPNDQSGLVGDTTHGRSAAENPVSRATGLDGRG
jgi:hypothetical protein